MAKRDNKIIGKELFESIGEIGSVTPNLGANLKKCKDLIEEFKKNNPEDNFNDKLRGSLNYTPLHEVVLCNKIDFVRLFIEMGADPTIEINLCSPLNRQAIYLAENFGKHNITAILRPYTDKWNLYGNISPELPWNITTYTDLRNTHPYGQVVVNQRAIIFTLLCISERLYNLNIDYTEDGNIILPLLPYIPPEIINLFLEMFKFGKLGQLFLKGGAEKKETKNFKEYCEQLSKYIKKNIPNIEETPKLSQIKNAKISQIENAKKIIEKFIATNNYLKEIIEVSNYVIDKTEKASFETHLTSDKSLFIDKLNALDEQQLETFKHLLEISEPSKSVISGRPAIQKSMTKSEGVYGIKKKTKKKKKKKTNLNK
jgi:hypothetical protein